MAQGGLTVFKGLEGLCFVLLTLTAAACITVEFPEQVELFPAGAPFVVKGTADLADVDGEPCLVWLAENGVIYHLFQDLRVGNEDYDRVTTPGVTSRLELATRSDLVVTCQIGTIVEVLDVLEIVE